MGSFCAADFAFMIYAHHVARNIHLSKGFAWLNMKWTLQDLNITGGVGSETRVVLPVDLYPKPLLRRAAEKKIEA